MKTTAMTPPTVARTARKNKAEAETFRAKDALDGLASSQTALPKIVYPSVFGNPSEKDMIWQSLDQLPYHEAVTPNSIRVQGQFSQVDVLGLNRSAVGQIDLNRGGIGMGDPAVFQGSTVHEIGHSVDFPGGTVSLLPGLHHSSYGNFGHGGMVSDYARTSPSEDFAESFRVFHGDPGRLQEVDATKHQAMQSLDEGNFLEELVDEPAFRETGKFIAESLEITPWLRTGLEIGRQVVVLGTGLLGARQTVAGVQSGDGLTTTAGLLGLGAGLGLALAYTNPLLGLGALALLGARKQLLKAEAQEKSPEEVKASAVGGAVGGLVGGTAGPLGLTYLGFAAAGPIGGAIGLLVGGAAGNYLGSELGAQAAQNLVHKERL